MLRYLWMVPLWVVAACANPSTGSRVSDSGKTPSISQEIFLSDTPATSEISLPTDSQPPVDEIPPPSGDPAIDPGAEDSPRPPVPPSSPPRSDWFLNAAGATLSSSNYRLDVTFAPTRPAARMKGQNYTLILGPYGGMK